jgi:hypothetical protein
MYHCNTVAEAEIEKEFKYNKLVDMETIVNKNINHLENETENVVKVENLLVKEATLCTPAATRSRFGFLGKILTCIKPNAKY